MIQIVYHSFQGSIQHFEFGRAAVSIGGSAWGHAPQKNQIK